VGPRAGPVADGVRGSHGAWFCYSFRKFAYCSKARDLISHGGHNVDIFLGM
jgi:hypothetical protein